MIGPRATTFLIRTWRPVAVKRPVATIAAVLVLLAAPLITLMPGSETEAASFFGCDVEPGSTAIEYGEVVGKATVECQEAWPDRVIRTEVWQMTTDSGWDRVEDSVTTWEGSDRVLPLHHPDTTGIECAILDHSTREYQTRIFVEDGVSLGEVAFGHPVRLGRDCLAAAGVGDPPPPHGVSAAASGGITCGIVPSVPVRQGGQIRAKTFFDCDALQNGEVRYLRVRLVENTPGPFDKVKRNRAFVDSSGLGRAFNLIAACNDKDSGTVTYYNSSSTTTAHR